jgi:NitT/TauT family transport system substrate-binding protein
MKKCIIAILSLTFLPTTLFFSAPAKETVTKQKPAQLRVAALNGPSSVPMAYLFENTPVLDGVPTVFEVAAGPDMLVPRLIKGEIDIGILPINLAAKVYTANNGSVVLGAIVGEGMINLVTKDPSVASLEDLRGKEIYVAGQGATPDYMFRYLLAARGVAIVDAPDPTGVTLNYSIPPAELAPALISGRIAYAVVPEPFATVVVNAAPDFRRAIDFQKEFAALEHSSYPVTALVIRADFARDNPEIAGLFLDNMREAIDWTNTHPAEAGALVQKHTLGLQGPIAAKSIPNSAFRFSAAADARPGVEKLLGIFLSSDPSSVGGKLPERGFYFP